MLFKCSFAKLIPLFENISLCVQCRMNQLGLTDYVQAASLTASYIIILIMTQAGQEESNIKIFKACDKEKNGLLLLVVELFHAGSTLAPTTTFRAREDNKTVKIFGF